MINAKIGDYFGLTAPLGSNFNIVDNRRFLLIGGGIGTAPIYYLAKYLAKNNIIPNILFGAKNKEFLEYSFDLEDCCNIRYYTDDGSFGIKGFVSNDIKQIITEKEYDCCCICGPEKMMSVIIDEVKGKINNIQLSMERYMKCGLGLCGSCVLDDIGLRVCEEGPVFSYFDTIVNCSEFGVYHRNGLGIIEK